MPGSKVPPSILYRNRSNDRAVTYAVARKDDPRRVVGFVTKVATDAGHHWVADLNRGQGRRFTDTFESRNAAALALVNHDIASHLDAFREQANRMINDAAG